MYRLAGEISTYYFLLSSWFRLLDLIQKKMTLFPSFPSFLLPCSLCSLSLPPSFLPSPLLLPPFLSPSLLLFFPSSLTSLSPSFPPSLPFPFLPSLYPSFLLPSPLLFPFLLPLSLPSLLPSFPLLFINQTFGIQYQVPY